MASVCNPCTITLPIDWEILDASSGLAFDIGGSVIKLAYISKETWKEPSERKKDSKGSLHLKSFSRENLVKAFEFIKHEVKLSMSPGKELLDVYSTGFGSAQYSEKFKEEISANNKILVEMDCFVKGFLYLVKNTPRKDILHSNPQNIYDCITKEVNNMASTVSMAKLSGQSIAYNGVNEAKLKDGITFPKLDSSCLDKPLTDLEELFPCVLAMIGSAFAAMVVNKDGSFLLLDGCSRGGSYLRRLGSLLCGTKTHGDFLKLCENGYLGNVTTTTQSMKQKIKQEGAASGKEDVYSKFATGKDMHEQPLYSFGMAPGKDLSDFNKEDLAIATAHAVASDMVQCAYSCAVLHGAKHVFFAGGVVSDTVIRNMCFAEWLRRDALMRVLNTDKRQPIQAHFMTHAQSLGAIGAFLNCMSGKQTPT